MFHTYDLWILWWCLDFPARNFSNICIAYEIKFCIGRLDVCFERGFCSVLLFCRSNPHPYITALENRVDCWPALLLEIDDFIQRAADRLARLQPRPWTPSFNQSLLHCMNFKNHLWRPPNNSSHYCQLLLCSADVYIHTHTMAHTVWMIFMA